MWCYWCHRDRRMIKVAGHLQCAVCKQIILPCCEGAPQ